MLVLSGESRLGRRDAATVLSIETALAKATLTRVEQRDPYRLFHKMTPCGMAEAHPEFRLDGLPHGTVWARLNTLNVTRPEFFKPSRRNSGVRPWTTGRRICAGTSSPQPRPVLGAIRRGRLRLLSQDPTRRCLAAAALEAMRGDVDDQLGEALGKEFVRRTFGTTKEETVRMTPRSSRRWTTRSALWLDEPGDQAPGARKAECGRNKVGYPDKWRDYSAVRIKTDDFFGDCQSAASFEVHRELNKIGKPVDRNEWGMTPPTVNAYYNPQMNDINSPPESSSRRSSIPSWTRPRTTETPVPPSATS